MGSWHWRLSVISPVWACATQPFLLPPSFGASLLSIHSCYCVWSTELGAELWWHAGHGPCSHKAESPVGRDTQGKRRLPPTCLSSTPSGSFSRTTKCEAQWSACKSLPERKSFQGARGHRPVGQWAVFLQPQSTALPAGGPAHLLLNLHPPCHRQSTSVVDPIFAKVYSQNGSIFW